MKYYYDIILNFNEENFDFYEWEEKDNCEFISKIPIIKLSTKSMTDLINNDITINKELLDDIEDKTLLNNKCLFKTIRYACIFSDDISTLAIEFDKEGNSIRRSSLSLDDDLDVLEISSKLNILSINYKLKNKIKVYKDTRKIRNIKQNIIQEINKLQKEKNVSKLTYLYLEMFDKNEDNISKIIHEINQNISSISINKLIEINNIIKLSYQNV